MSAPNVSPWAPPPERLRVLHALEELGSALVGAHWQGMQLSVRFVDGVFQCLIVPPILGPRPAVFIERWPADALRSWEQWTEPEL